MGLRQAEARGGLIPCARVHFFTPPGAGENPDLPARRALSCLYVQAPALGRKAKEGALTKHAPSLLRYVPCGPDQDELVPRPGGKCLSFGVDSQTGHACAVPQALAVSSRRAVS